MGRPRKHKTLAGHEGLYRDANGYFFVRNPITKEQAWLRTQHEATAKILHSQISQTWREATLEQQAQKVADKLKRTRSAHKFAFSDYCRKYRLERLPTALGKKKQPLGEKTKMDYERMLRNSFESHEGFQVKPEDISARVLRVYLAQWIDNPSMRNYRLSLLSRVCEAAVTEGVLDINPARHITRSLVAERRVYVADDHYSQIITNEPVEWHARMYDLVYLVSSNPIDALRLTHENVAGDTIRFTRRKNGQLQEITDLTGDLIDTIEWFRRWKEDQNILAKHVVCYPKTTKRRLIGKPITVDYLSRVFALAVAAAGFEPGTYTPRDLRPKALTDEAVIEGAPTAKGGHMTESMQRRYVKTALPMRATSNLRKIR